MRGPRRLPAAPRGPAPGRGWRCRRPAVRRARPGAGGGSGARAWALPPPPWFLRGFCEKCLAFSRTGFAVELVYSRLQWRIKSRSRPSACVPNCPALDSSPGALLAQNCRFTAYSHLLLFYIRTILFHQPLTSPFISFFHD